MLRGDTVDSTISANDLANAQPAKAVAVAAHEDSLAFFQALWFWIPTALGLWAGIIWAITRIF